MSRKSISTLNYDEVLDGILRDVTSRWSAQTNAYLSNAYLSIDARTIEKALRDPGVTSVYDSALSTRLETYWANLSEATDSLAGSISENRKSLSLLSRFGQPSSAPDVWARCLNCSTLADKPLHLHGVLKYAATHEGDKPLHLHGVFPYTDTQEPCGEFQYADPLYVFRETLEVAGPIIPEYTFIGRAYSYLTGFISALLEQQIEALNGLRRVSAQVQFTIRLLALVVNLESFALQGIAIREREHFVTHGAHPPKGFRLRVASRFPEGAFTPLNAAS